MLLDGYDIAGGGQVSKIEPVGGEGRRAVDFLDDFSWRQQAVDGARWQQRLGHKAALVLLVGEVGVGKSELATGLQERLFTDGLHPVLVDADNVLAGAPKDTSLDTATELLRGQFSRTIAPLLSAGLVVVATSNALGLADHGWLAEELGAPLLCVLLSPDRNARLVDADIQVYGSAERSETLDRLAKAVAALVK